MNSKIIGAILYVRVSFAYIIFQIGIIIVKIIGTSMNNNINILSF